MILTCPYCDTRFNFDAQHVQEGPKKVQCCICHEVWLQTKSGILTYDRPPTATQDHNPLKTKQPVKRSFRPYMLACFLAFILTVFFTCRQPILETFPTTAFIYEKMGFDVPPFLQIKHVSIAPKANGQGLVFKAKIVNKKSFTQFIPPLSLSNDTGDLHEFTLEDRLIKPYGRHDIHVTLDHIPYKKYEYVYMLPEPAPAHPLIQKIMSFFGNDNN
jgi:hypothetical protein